MLYYSQFSILRKNLLLCVAASAERINQKKNMVIASLLEMHKSNTH